ncbi:MAG: hypothetical protein LLF95_11260 [Bacteroidales bacterium]|nr:hypothetical protein [Bacteroidales bacterium]
MTADEKTNLDLDIMNLVNKLIEDPTNTKDVIMYIRGDKEFETASINIKGDVQLLASTIQHHLDNNEEFKRFLLSVLGSWMAKNPIDEKMFLNGLEIAKKTFSIN